MDSLLETIMDNPLYLVGVIILGLVVVFFLVKKVFKIFLFLLVLGGLYAGYLYFFNPEGLKDLQKKLKGGKEQLQGIDEATKDFRDDAVDKAIQEARKKLEKRN